jgi:hypothetical protein
LNVSQEVAKNTGGVSVEHKLESNPALLTVEDINALAAAVNWCALEHIK